MIRIRTVTGQLRPPDRRRRNDARPDSVGDHRFRRECAAIVVNGNAITAGDVAGGRVVRVNLDRRLAGGAAQRRDVDERGVEKLVCGRRDQRERIALDELRVAFFLLVGRDVRRQSVDARGGETLRFDLDLPARRAQLRS